MAAAGSIDPSEGDILMPAPFVPTEDGIGRVSFDLSGSVDLDEGSVRSGFSGKSFSNASLRGISRKSIGSIYRASRSASGDLWNNSFISESISDRHDIDNLRDLCGNDYSFLIDPEELRHVKVLGEGAFAGNQAKSGETPPF